jgi:nucleotide-binding universal stress UspA family protein
MAMTIAPQVTFLGVMCAFIFCLSMASLLWWMLHPPRQVSLPVAKAMVAVSAIRKIIVPVQGTTYAYKAVELACRLGKEQKAEILVTYIIEVPFTMPLGAPMDKAAAEAQRVLERAEEIVRHSNLPCKPVVEKARQISEGIIRLAKEEAADLIVIGIQPIIGLPDRIMGRTSEAILRKAPCEVILDRRYE